MLFPTLFLLCKQDSHCLIHNYPSSLVSSRDTRFFLTLLWNIRFKPWILHPLYFFLWRTPSSPILIQCLLLLKMKSLVFKIWNMNNLLRDWLHKSHNSTIALDLVKTIHHEIPFNIFFSFFFGLSLPFFTRLKIMWSTLLTDASNVLSLRQKPP